MSGPISTAPEKSRRRMVSSAFIRRSPVLRPRSPLDPLPPSPRDRRATVVGEPSLKAEGALGARVAHLDCQTALRNGQAARKIFRGFSQVFLRKYSEIFAGFDFRSQVFSQV